MTRGVLVALLVFGAAFHASAQTDVLTRLGTTVRQAHDSVFMTLTSGVVSLTGERAVFQTATGEARASMVRAVIAVARAFAASPEFRTRYALYRQAQRPRRSEAARTGGEAMAQQQEAMELAIKQAMAHAAQLPADARQQLEASVAEMRQQIAELNADPEYRATVDEMAVAAAKHEDEEYAQKLAVFDAEFPEDVRALIGQRLRQFLMACGDVDFAARLEPGEDKKLRFVNLAYERRSAEWKMCFRAGQPAVDAARAAANNWLETLTAKQ